jgi:vancomycin permeability regulator SanA
MKLLDVLPRKFLRFLVVITILFVISFTAINLYILQVARDNTHTPEHFSSDNSIDAIIVLGAAMYNSGPSLMLRDRLDAAISLYEIGVSDRILVSGDHGQDDYNEVEGMRTYLLAAGIPDMHIFMDHAGFDTYSSMYRAKDIFLIDTAIISTQEFHLYRAVYLARRLGIDASGVICDKHDYLFMGKNELRESFARVKACFQAELLHSQPRYLGDPIDIHGSGINTHD